MTVDEAVKLRTDAILQEAAVPIEVTVRDVYKRQPQTLLMRPVGRERRSTLEEKIQHTPPLPCGKDVFFGQERASEKT